MQEFVYLIENEASDLINIYLEEIKEYGYGSERVNIDKIKSTLNKWLLDYDFEITDEVQHKFRIGNNNSFYVRDKNGNDFELIACLNINDLFGKAAIYVDDILNERVSEKSIVVTAKEVCLDNDAKMDWNEYWININREKKKRTKKEVYKQR